MPGPKLACRIVALFGASAIVACSAITACADSTGTGTTARRTALTYDFINGPEDPAPIVLRSSHDDFFVLFNTDRNSDLASLVRLPDPPDDVVPCGGSQPLEPADLQLVFHRNGSTNQLFIGRQVRAFVYERRSFLAALRAGGGLCAAIASQAPLAQGLVDFAAHDNDTFFSGIHADAFGWSARGTFANATDGSRLRYLNELHGVIAADGSVAHVVSSISLTPITVP